MNYQVLLRCMVCLGTETFSQDLTTGIHRMLLIWKECFIILILMVVYVI